MRLTAIVPATSANLGPGFDSFGLALGLCNEVTLDTDAEPGVTWDGEGADELPTDGTDLVSRAMRFAQARIDASHGAGMFPLPPLRLHGINRIPIASGLGSSAASAVAGIALAYRLLDLDDPASSASNAFVLASEMEGHPDNAAAAAFGGLTVVAGESVERVDPDPRLRPVLLVPRDLRVSTDEARRALPARVPLEDAVFNASHAAMTLIRLMRDPGGLRPAMRDRLHQDARLALVPKVREVFVRLQGSNVPVCVSGSGPSLLAFEWDGAEVPDPGEGWRVLRVPVRASGVEIREG